MINRYQVMMLIGAVLVLLSSIPIYYSHQESVISYNHVNASTCIRVLSGIVNESLVSSGIEKVMRSMEQSLLISIEVNVNYANGSSITYGYYIPVGESGVAITPMVSGNIEIFGRSHCAYVGGNYVINVFIGQYVTPLYLFGLGVVFIIMGFILIALGDYLKDRCMRNALSQG